MEMWVMWGQETLDQSFPEEGSLSDARMFELIGQYKCLHENRPKSGALCLFVKSLNQPSMKMKVFSLSVIIPGFKEFPSN